MADTIRELLGRAVSGSATESDIEALVLGLAKELQPMAAGRRSSRLRLEGYSGMDIALIALASLFARDAQGSFPILAKTFERILGRPEAPSTAEIDRYVRGVLSRRLQETLFALAGEINPGKAKIRREFLYALRKSPSRTLAKTPEGHWVLPSPRGEGPTGDSLPFDVLLDACIRARLWGLQVPKFLVRLESGLESEERLRPWRLSDLVTAYESINRGEPPVECGVRPGHDDPGREDQFRPRLDGWLREWDVRLQSRLEFYQRKKKIAADETEPLRLALLDIVKDGLEGRPEQKFPDHLESRGLHADPAVYRKRYRPIVEYLAKLGRRFIEEKVRAWKSSAP
jgi:hypothetical protein